MPNSEIIRIFKAELKENLIRTQKYYHNTSDNIDNEINSSIIPHIIKIQFYWLKDNHMA